MSSDSFSDAADDLSEGELYLEELGQAVAAKVEELGTDVHPELGPLALRYADALLTKEENNLDPLANTNEEDEDGGDLQVAWECFEQARLCFEGTTNTDDLAFIHQRLGDLTSLQGNFEVAVQEYIAALQLLPEAGDLRQKAGILVPLGQAYAIQQHYPAAKAAYVLARDALAMFPTSPDLLASISDIQQSINDCDAALGEEPVKAKAPEQPKENEFDKSTLESKEVVEPQVRRKQKDNDPKRQRTS